VSYDADFVGTVVKNKGGRAEERQEDTEKMGKKRRKKNEKEGVLS
jgi:hypothetical protein